MDALQLPFLFMANTCAILGGRECLVGVELAQDNFL